MQSSQCHIAFQGKLGAYSHIACRDVYPNLIPYPCASFEEVFQAVENGIAGLAMLPIENSLAGRVADVHHLLPTSSLYVTGEHFLRVQHNLLGLKGTQLSDLTTVHSHIQALGQCRRVLRELDVAVMEHTDTAGAARDISVGGDQTQGAIASELAAEIYGLDILRHQTEDADHNHTRFLILSKEPSVVSAEEDGLITSLIFRVRSVPAALYKALGGFATNGVNLTRLESFMLDGTFSAAQFYLDAEGHPEQRALSLALEELNFFAHEVRVIGTYPAHPYRQEAIKNGANSGSP